MACRANRFITFSLLATHRVKLFEKSAQRSTAKAKYDLAPAKRIP